MGAGAYYWPNIRGAWFSLKSPPEDITERVSPSDQKPPDAKNETGMPASLDASQGGPLKLPPGFSISIFAKNLPGARDMIFDGFGNMWVSRTREGALTELVVENGVIKLQSDRFLRLNTPHGLAIDPQNSRVLFFAEADKISLWAIGTRSLQNKVIDLPAGGNHNYHSIRFGPDDRLYVKIGSTCNVCIEKDERRAKIYSLKRDGTDFREFARGLRNAPFMAFNPVDGKMWVTEMGRDFLGDDLPPDEINMIELGNPSTGLGTRNYGWPNCYGKNVHDTDFDHNTYIRNPCTEPFEIPSYIDIPAHSAPLGLAFVPHNSAWPEDYWYDLIVAYHGSWNRTTPTGYKVVRMKLDTKGNYEGTEDFITGWLTKAGPLGRPVGILIQPDGTMYVSDDKAGVVYKVNRRQ